MKKTKNKNGVILSGFIVIAVLAVVFIILNPKKDINDTVDRLYQLPADYTLEQAVKDGMIDVSGVREKESQKINQFLHESANHIESTLKTVQTDGDEVIVKVFFYDNELDRIRSWTYRVKQQAAEAPDKQFLTEYETMTEGEAARITLKNVASVTDPLLQEEFEPIDEVLYSYKK